MGLLKLILLIGPNH